MKLYIVFYEVFFIFCIKKNYQGIIDKYNNKDKRILFYDYQHNETIVLSTTCTDISILNCHIKFYNSQNIQLSLNGVLPSLFEFSSIASNHNSTFEIFIIGGYGYDFSPNMNLYRITFNNNIQLNLTKIKINYGYTESAISFISPIQSIVVYGGHNDINIINKMLLFDINSNKFSLIKQNPDYFSLTKRKGHSLTFIEINLPFLPEIKNEHLYPLIVLFGKNEYDYTRQIDVIIIKKEFNTTYYLNNTYSINELIRGYVYPEPREGHTSLYSKDTNSIFLFGGCNYKENRCFNHMIYRLRLFDLYWEKFPFHSTVKSTEILLVNSNTFLFENGKGQLERATIKMEEVKKSNNRPRRYSWKTIKKNIEDNNLLNKIISKNETEIDEIIQKILAALESNYLGEQYKELKELLSQIKEMKKDKFNILNIQLSDIKNKFKVYIEKHNKDNKKTEAKCNNTVLIKPNTTIPNTNHTKHITNGANITKIAQMNNNTQKIIHSNNTHNISKPIKNLTVNHTLNVSHNYTNKTVQDKSVCNTCNKTSQEKNKTIESKPHCNRCNKTKLINQSKVNSTISTIQGNTTKEHNNNTIPNSNLTQKNNVTHNDTHPVNNITQLKSINTTNSTSVSSTIQVKKIAHATLHIPLGKHSKKRFKGYSFLQKGTVIPPPKNDSNLTPLLLGLSGIVFLTLLYCFTSRTENNSLIK